MQTARRRTATCCRSWRRLWGAKWQQLPQVPAQALLPLQQNSISLPVAIKQEAPGI